MSTLLARPCARMPAALASSTTPQWPQAWVKGVLGEGLGEPCRQMWQYMITWVMGVQCERWGATSPDLAVEDHLGAQHQLAVLEDQAVLNGRDRTGGDQGQRRSQDGLQGQGT